MPTYGVTSTGFVAKSTRDILDELEAEQLANISPTLDLSSESPLGQINGIVAAALAEAWEVMEAAYESFDPANASDAQLTALAAVTGTLREGATKSTVLCTCDLDAGTYAAGALVANVSGNGDARFVNAATLIVPGGVQAGVVFEAEQDGPVAAPAGQLTVIAQPVTGWNSITNPDDAVLGQLVESDPALRVRREVELAAGGSNTVRAIRSAVSKVAGIESVDVLENTGDSPDSNGLPPHSVEAVVFDGVVPAAEDDEIAQAIWDSNAGGIRAYGLTTATAEDDVGVEHDVSFTRVDVVDVYVSMDVDAKTSAPGYPGEAGIKSAIAALDLGIGGDVIVRRLEAAVMGVAGVVDVTETRIGFSPSPSGTANLAISVREYANISIANIDINVNPV